jgi:aminocarboxymuconate-semialdehyde decarboxylase
MQSAAMGWGDVIKPRANAVVDFHAHMIPPGCITAAVERQKWHGVSMSLNPSGGLSWKMEGRRWNLTWENSEAGWSDRLSKMDEIGVDVQVLSVSPALYWYRTLDPARARALAEETNDAIAAAVELHPDRFMGLAHLPLQDPGAAVRELERSIADLGLAGIAVPGNVAGKDWDSPALLPILEAAQQLGGAVFVHPATDVRFPAAGSPYFFENIVGIPLETTVAFASMIFGGVFDRLPELRVCLAHGGGFACTALGRFDHAFQVRPECGRMLRRPSDYASEVWWDSLTHSHAKLRALLDQVGSSRVVLGTDYPADMGQPEPVRWVRSALQLSPEEQEAVLTTNALELLGRHRFAKGLQ